MKTSCVDLLNEAFEHDLKHFIKENLEIHIQFDKNNDITNYKGS